MDDEEEVLIVAEDVAIEEKDDPRVVGKAGVGSSRPVVGRRSGAEDWIDARNT